MFNFKTLTISLTVLIGLTAQTALYAKGQSHISYEYVPVISATPVSKIIQHSTPYQDCWSEQVQIEPSRTQPAQNSYFDSMFDQNSYTGTVLGTLVGGGIGNALGHSKSNKKAGAVAGGILGGAVAYDLTHNRRTIPEFNRARYETRQRCTTRYKTYEEEKVVGYRVRYRYNGSEYTTQTKHEPGDTLRMKLVATPVED